MINYFFYVILSGSKYVPMKRRLIGYLSLFLLSISGCSKEKQADEQQQALQSTSSEMLTGSCGAIYADTVYYPSDYPAGYEVRPLTGLAGSFGSYPDGLEMDERNGNIEIKQSLTGLKYLVWYVPRGSTDTCKAFLTVSGVNYPDSIYAIKSASGLSTPVYNASLQQPAPCTANCEFDDGHDDDNGNGFADEPPLGQEMVPQGVSMDKSSGAINLKQSILDGALGSNPAPGTFKDFVLNYRLTDRTSKALNRMTLRLYYYKNKSQVPAALKKDLEEKKKFILLNNISDPYKVSYTVKKSGSGSTSREREVKCRPAYIIIVQQ